jgi:hypothetical protein
MKTTGHIIILLSMICGGVSLVEGKELRVLFVGNSYTYMIQNAFQDLVSSSPHSQSTISQVANGGWRLTQHLNSNATLEAIRNGNWDYVVLQEHSRRPTLPNERQLFYDAVSQLSGIIRESRAQVVLYMTWGRRDRDNTTPEINPDYETMQRNLIEAYTKAARSVDALVSPVGIAWQLVRSENSALGQQLYAADGSHPSDKGAFLVACVFYATLFNDDPTQLESTGGLPQSEAMFLKTKAIEAFIPSADNADINRDGFVDSSDIAIMADHWGEDYATCDIGPYPWGDGNVNVDDLVVLTDHLYAYPGALAHWAFDEIDGSIALDGIGDYNGTLLNGPVWRPTDGVKNGCLELDGNDDFVSTAFEQKGPYKPLSVFAWVKGGHPGQVIISQQDGANWLMANDVDGALQTKLSEPSKNIRGKIKEGPSLSSSFEITDGQWHRVGLVWDSISRILYVDDVEVARDSIETIESVPGGLYIGAGSHLEPDSFWSGLIDDVLIYSRVVTP